MRLKEYINESEFYSTENWETLKNSLDKKCKPYINELRGVNNLLIRGVSNSTVPQFMTIRKVRKNRKPRLLYDDLHTKIGNLSKDLFGWNIRTEGLFCTKSTNDTDTWGRPVIIFPIGNFKYVWNDDVTDLYNYYDIYQSNDDTFSDIEQEVQDYKTNNLNKYLRLPNTTTSECIVNTDMYYSINMEWYETLLKYYAG